MNRSLRIPVFAVVCVLLLVPFLGRAQIGGFDDLIREAIDEVRAFAQEELGAQNIGSAYAAMINFAGNPDVSTATYYIDDPNAVDATLDVFRVGLRHEWGEKEDRWRPFVQALFPYQTLEYKEPLLGGDRVDVSWKAYGVVGTAGAEYRVNSRLRITPALNFGSVRLESNAGYQGGFAENILEPALDGLAYDWEADAWVAGLSLWMDYRREFDGFDAAFHAGVTHNHVESYRVSSELIHFSSRATTVAGSVETIHPTPVEIWNFPISLVLTGGATAFLGPGREALGFDRFYDGGVAFEADIDRWGLPVRTLRLGLLGIVGPNVTGWSLIFNYSF